MKRPLGLIGLVYLSALAVIFYFFSPIICMAAAALGAFTATLGIFFKLTHRGVRVFNSVIAVGITIVCAVLSMTGYTALAYSGAEDLFEQELEISGYVCDEITENGKVNYITIQTDKINGEPNRQKLALTAYQNYGVSDFDKVTAVLTVHKAERYYMSRRIFLRSKGEDILELSSVGEKQVSLYSGAVALRRSVRSSLSSRLSPDSAALCKAVLLGDKNALDREILNDFYETGSSFLIVVSGMHLSIAVGAVMFFLKRVTRNTKLILAIIALFVLSYVALTGFTPSVMRAAVVALTAYASPLVSRRANGINSLGLAALILTLPNPYSVGDTGLLLSFSSTLGILLWAEKLGEYICTRLHFRKKLLRGIANAVAVSLSASIWVAPLSVLFFGKLSPVVIAVAVLCEIPVSVVLVCSMFIAVLSPIPFVSILSFPFVFIAEIFCGLILHVIGFFASLPFSSVRADKLYFYVWILFSAILVAVGYIVRAKSFYIRCAVLLSVAMLIAGWGVATLFELNTISLSVLRDKTGIFVTLQSDGGISFLSAGGRTNAKKVAQELNGNYSAVDFCVVPRQDAMYASGLSMIYEDYDIGKIFVYDSDGKPNKGMESFYDEDYLLFGKNCELDLEPGTQASDLLINEDGDTYQFLTAGERTLLFVPEEADIAQLPEKYRSADYVLITDIPKNFDLLSFDYLISGTDETDEMSIDDESILAIEQELNIKLK